MCNPGFFYFFTWVNAENVSAGDLIENDSNQIKNFKQALA